MNISLNICLDFSIKDFPFYMVSADTQSSFNKTEVGRNCRIFNERITAIVNIYMQPLVTIF